MSRSILNRVDKDDVPDNLFDQVFALLSALDGVPQSAEELEDFYIPRPQKKSHNLRSVVQHKRQGQDAWLAILGIVQSKDERKRILSVISTNIAPWFTKPELLSDFLTSCYNTGGSMSLLALSGVFYLIQERNLDYPSFYPKLYSLLDKDILHSKHRSRFFRLLDTFLGSTHLPAALVASFIKRLSRLSLNAPPSAIATVIPWIYNLLRRHPTCTFMVHRDVQDPELKKHIQNNGAEDAFNPTETDPMETGAIDSSLWEVVQLQSHYHPNVATIAKILAEQFTKQSYNMEDFLDHSYASVSAPRCILLSVYVYLLTHSTASGRGNGQGHQKGPRGGVPHPKENFLAPRRARHQPRQPLGQAVGLWSASKWCRGCIRRPGYCAVVRCILTSTAIT